MVKNSFRRRNLRRNERVCKIDGWRRSVRGEIVSCAEREWESVVGRLCWGLSWGGASAAFVPQRAETSRAIAISRQLPNVIFFMRASFRADFERTYPRELG